MTLKSTEANGNCASCGRSLFGKRKHEFAGKLFGGRCIYKVRGTGKLAAALLGDGVTKKPEPAGNLPAKGTE